LAAGVREDIIIDAHTLLVRTIPGQLPINTAGKGTLSGSRIFHGEDR
jgi:hypothetical protein